MAETRTRMPRRSSWSAASGRAPRCCAWCSTRTRGSAAARRPGSSPTCDGSSGRDWERLSQYGFRSEDWLRRIGDFFGGVQPTTPRSRGKTRWADKTPLYAMSLDFVTEVFPDAQIVHLIRDGRDVVVSHRKRFGYWSAVKCVVKWPRYIDAARAAGATLPAGPLLRAALRGGGRRRRRRRMRGLFDFLGEPWEPACSTTTSSSTTWRTSTPPRRNDDGRRGRPTAPIYGSRVGTLTAASSTRSCACWSGSSRSRTLRDAGLPVSRGPSRAARGRRPPSPPRSSGLRLHRGRVFGRSRSRRRPRPTATRPRQPARRRHTAAAASRPVRRALGLVAARASSCRTCRGSSGSTTYDEIAWCDIETNPGQLRLGRRWTRSRAQPASSASPCT